MILHILPGDSLAEHFPPSIPGHKLICRECLIDGDLHGDTLEAFWQTRAQFIQSDYGEGNYCVHVVAEFEKLNQYNTETEFNLWFEYELFCQTNLWFVLYLLQLKGFKHIFRVCPGIKQGHDVWQGFSGMTEADLEDSFANRIKLTENDLQQGVNLWHAYQAADLNLLEPLSHYQSAAFPMLNDVCRAEIERKQNNRVENTLKAIMASGTKDFAGVFELFQQKAGIYGFGDLQIKKLYEQLR